jgi:hypothetical protein
VDKDSRNCESTCGGECLFALNSHGVPGGSLSLFLEDAHNMRHEVSLVLQQP